MSWSFTHYLCLLTSRGASQVCCALQVQLSPTLQPQSLFFVQQHLLHGHGFTGSADTTAAARAKSAQIRIIKSFINLSFFYCFSSLYQEFFANAILNFRRKNSLFIFFVLIRLLTCHISKDLVNGAMNFDYLWLYWWRFSRLHPHPFLLCCRINVFPNSLIIF